MCVLMKKGGLGKGLDALFVDNAAESEQGGAVSVRISEIEPNREQPRKSFDDEALTQLSESIRQHGVLQPLLVRPIPGLGNYQLVAGERRWRAARMAGLSEVPVIIREMEDSEAMEIALIENLQRQDLNPIEEAEGYKSLMDGFSLTQEEISKRVGKSRPAVANSLRLLSLPEKVLDMVKNGALSQGHARALMAIEDSMALEKTAMVVSQNGLSVRDTEKLAKKVQTEGTETVAAARKLKNSVLVTEIEASLADYLGRKVKINQGRSKGVLEIEFYGEEDLRQLSLALYDSQNTETKREKN